MIKLTFKNHKAATGLSRIGTGEDGADIKIKRKRVGFISPRNKFHKCRVFIAVRREKTYEDPCPFFNYRLPIETETVAEMKDLLVKNAEELLKDLDFYVDE